MPDADVARALAHIIPKLDAEERGALVKLAAGSIGTALQFADDDGVAFAREADRLIDASANPDIPALLALGDRLWRKADGLENFGTFLADALSLRIRAKAKSGGARLDAWIEAVERVRAKFSRSSALYLEPRQTIISSALTLEDARAARARYDAGR